MTTIDTRVLIVGSGAAALVAAKVAAGRGLPCLVAGHEPIDDTVPAVLSDEATAALRPHGVLDVLRPYAAAQEPFTISPLEFEQGLKHHCVADMLITVYDRMWFERAPSSVGELAVGTLTDGRSSWDVRADELFEAEFTDLDSAIRCGAAFANAVRNTP